MCTDGHGVEELGSFPLALSPNPPRLAFTARLPPYSSTVPPSSIRDVVNPLPGSSSGGNGEMRSSFAKAMTGFGNTTPAAGSGRASPVVLVPTNFASASAESSRSASPFVVGPAGASLGKKGFVDLESFYDEDDDQAEDESEDESESEDEESGDAESEEEESEDESGDDESSDDAEPSAAPATAVGITIP